MLASETTEKAVVADLTVAGDTLRAELRLGDEERRIRYRLGGVEPARATDALAVALLPIAMSRHWALELPGRPSPRLQDGLDSAQDVLAGWWDHWSRVQVVGDGGAADPAPAPGRGVACFFTGGVDSFHSVLAELDRLDAVIFVHGFDVPLADAPKRELVGRTLGEAADELGLELIEVETNVKRLTWPGCKWGFHAHGAALASVAHLLSSRFREVVIPATHGPLDLYPWGSHPTLDPLWSSEAVELVHHGPLSRTRKVATLARSETALRHLRCCYHEAAPGEVNCGRCEKCLRTMASLRIAGALERCATLPSELPLDEVSRMPVLGRGWATLIRDLEAEARTAGDAELAGALRTALQVEHFVRPAVLPDDREAMLSVLEPEGLARIPSPEMDDFDVGHWLVAERDGEVVGVAGYRIERKGDGVTGRNLLLAVLQQHRGRGIGRSLVDRRLQLMREAGATRVVTNTDRPDLIAWLERDYGYSQIGEVEKLHPFGRPEVDRWTTLETRL